MVQLVRWLRLRNARSETASVQRVRRQPWASAVGSTPETALSSSLSCEEGRVEYECDYQMRSRLDRQPSFGRLRRHEIGRASCRESVCQYVEVWVVAVILKTKK